MWLVSPHNHHNKVSEKVTTVLCVQTPRNNTVASLSILREQGTPTPLPGPGYQQSQEWGPRRSWDRRSSERARVETVVAPVTPVAAVSVAPEPPEAADISRSRSGGEMWRRIRAGWDWARDGAYSGTGVSESVSAGAAIPVGAGAGQSILSQPWLGNLSPAPAALATHSVASPGSRHHHYLRQWADGSQDIQYTERNLQDKGCN